ncbi:MAG: 6-phosphogluconolactonase [Thermoplasmatales archaeon]|nr:6-phosphogluconolactonase [Thermoplasmatales archaeon]
MVEILFEKGEIYKKISSVIANSINQILSEKDEVILGLPGGRSISNILQFLKMENIDWNKIHVFMIDERLVPIDDDESNFKLIEQGLSDIIPIKNLHPFYYNETKEDHGLLDYKEEIMKYGGKYDIILVSSGEDGHIGALYPNHSSIRDESNYLISMNNSPKPPSKRISISKKILLKSKIGILIFVGDMKREAYSNFLDEEIDITMCPAKLVAQLPESFVLTDIELKEEIV